jgi:nucleoid DNA-binding protein
MAEAKKTDAKKPAPKSITKSEFFGKISEATGKTKKEVQEVYDAIKDLIVKELKKKNGGLIKLPDMFQLKVFKTKAIKGGDKYLNRLTGKEEIRKPKPAKTKVRARTLKILNDAITG